MSDIECSQIDASNSSDDDEDINLKLDESSIDDEPTVDETNKKRKNQVWSVEKIFNNEIEARKAVEVKWSYKKTHRTNSGPKDYYNCSINPKCPAKMHLHFINTSEEVNMLRNDKEHRHEAQCETRGINRTLKQEIIKMFDINVTAPLSIIYNLRKLKYKNLPKPKQISNFLSKYRKKQKGDTQINYDQMKQKCLELSTKPSDPNQPYVISYEVDSSKKEGKAFRFSISTYNLLKLAKENDKFLCTDATYKLIYQGFPVLLVGHVDLNRQFHPSCIAVTSGETCEDFSFIFNSIKE